jgi:hypothetical protein
MMNGDPFRSRLDARQIVDMGTEKMRPEIARILQEVGSGNRMRAATASLRRQLRIRNSLLITTGIGLLILQVQQLQNGL